MSARVLKLTHSKENEIVAGSYIWPIKNFLSENWTHLKSPVFSIGSQNEIKLKLHISKMTTEEDLWYAIYISVEEISIPLPKVMTVEQGVSIVSLKEEQACTWIQQENSTYLEKDDLSYIATISKTTVTGNPRVSILDDEFTLIYEISIREVSSKLASSAGTISNDLKAFFDKRVGGDVKFLVGSQELIAHKAIVSARSSVLSAMLKTQTTKSSQNQVEIENIRAEIFAELLRFMYTDEVGNLEENAYELLHAAHKYNLPQLKFMCEEQLYRILDLKNCTKVLITADAYKLEKLKQRALNFIANNATIVMNTEGCKLLLRSQPDLMIEVFQALAIKTSVK